MKLRPLLIAGVALSVAACGLAAAAPEKMTRRCVIASRDCWTVNAGFKHLTPEARVDRLNDRLARIIGRENLSASNVRTVRRGPFTDLYVGASHLFTCTPGDARAEGLRSSVALASRWAANLRRALPQARPRSNPDFPQRLPAAMQGHGVGNG